jgi:uncharacterized protein YdhG (YjbR/CyaY superfamily)
MKIQAKNPEEYIEQLPPERKLAMQKLRTAIKNNLPNGFEETINYGMIGYVVPHSIYPEGYYCNPELPLPFINIASQKNFIALYHMGIYADKKLFQWFQKNYSKHCKAKLDMGKSCVRFKKMEEIPYQLIEELCQKTTPEKWINTYESVLKR